ncbi:N(4)-acetylcytidine aminohydrolase [Rheinheimera salexigens]|nr:N(4)-acetylcytidine aminohydrolase [Rheinheimera salexigens]
MTIPLKAAPTSTATAMKASSINTAEPAPTLMTFFTRFEADILAGKKTITIRDGSESNYLPGSTVTLATHESGRVFGQAKILTVTPILFSALSNLHAEQENMSLDELKQVITDIYPSEQQLFVVSFQHIVKA